MNELFLVRHAESDWNSQRRLQGHADRPLSRRGREQALALGTLLQARQFDAVISSDLQRTLDTAALAGFNANASDLWREFDVGHWSGRVIDEIADTEGDDYLRWRAGEYAPPGGEAWSAFESRLRYGLGVLEAIPGRVLLVTHSGVIRAIMKIILGVPPGTLTAVGHASISVLGTKPAPSLACYDFRPDRIQEAVLD